MHWPRRSFNRLGMFNNAFRWKSSNYPQLHPLHISFILLIYTRLRKSTAYATKAVGLKMRYNLHSTSSFLMKSWEERRLKFNLTIWFNWGHQPQWRVRDTSGQSRPTYVRGAWRIVNTTSGVGSSFLRMLGMLGMLACSRIFTDLWCNHWFSFFCRLKVDFSIFEWLEYNLHESSFWFLLHVQDVRTFTRESLSFTVPKRARKHDHEYKTSKGSEG